MRWVKKLRNLMAIAGVAMLLCAAALTGYFCWEQYHAKQCADELLAKLQEQLDTAADAEQETPILPETAQPDEEAAETETADAEPEETDETETEAAQPELDEAIAGRALGILELTEQGVTLPVMNEYSEALLKQYPCRWAEDECAAGQIIIAGHNYQSHFRCLWNMQTGEEVVLTTMDGARKVYTVLAVEEISGENKEALLAGTWDLSLFTCASNRKNRVVVRCILEEENG